MAGLRAAQGQLPQLQQRPRRLRRLRSLQQPPPLTPRRDIELTDKFNSPYVLGAAASARLRTILIRSPSSVLLSLFFLWFVSQVDYWTDFLKAPLSRRSCVLVRGAWHGVTPFAGFGDGRALAPQDALEDAVDGMRHLAEECDSIETLQCLLDDQSGARFLGAAPLRRS